MPELAIRPRRGVPESLVRQVNTAWRNPPEVVTTFDPARSLTYRQMTRAAGSVDLSRFEHTHSGAWLASWDTERAALAVLAVLDTYPHATTPNRLFEAALPLFEALHRNEMITGRCTPAQVRRVLEALCLAAAPLLPVPEPSEAVGFPRARPR